MKKAFAVVAMLAFAAVAHAQYTVELDLNGVQGDGPDFIEVMVSDYVTGDLWIYGPNMLFSWGCIVCNFDGSLEFQGFVYSTPAGWTNAAVQVGADGCITVQATDFSFTAPMPLPWLVGTFTFHAAVDQSIDDITFGDAGWLDINFISGVMDNANTLAGTVKIGDIPQSTEESSWGAVKGLFR
ncbi:MAG: hypothetical protein ABIK65_08410 [Candidatus Eisenbacteria bacterium]